MFVCVVVLLNMFSILMWLFLTIQKRCNKVRCFMILAINTCILQWQVLFDSRSYNYLLKLSPTLPFLPKSNDVIGLSGLGKSYPVGGILADAVLFLHRCP